MRGTGAAAVLAVVVFAAMTALTGVAQAVVVYGLATVQVALLVARRPASRPQQFLAIWSVQAGLTYLWAGDDTAASTLVYVLVGVVFAAGVTWFLAHAHTLDDLEDGPADTRPLPVTAADEE